MEVLVLIPIQSLYLMSLCYIKVKTTCKTHSLNQSKTFGLSARMRKHSKHLKQGHTKSIISICIREKMRSISFVSFFPIHTQLRRSIFRLCTPLCWLLSLCPHSHSTKEYLQILHSHPLVAEQHTSLNPPWLAFP